MRNSGVLPAEEGVGSSVRGANRSDIASVVTGGIGGGASGGAGGRASLGGLRGVAGGSLGGGGSRQARGIIRCSNGNLETERSVPSLQQPQFQAKPEFR